MGYVLDYSAGTPGAKAIKGFGALGVVRYAGTPGRKKNLTKAEFVDLDRAGLGVATVYENKAGDFLGGYAAGQRAARDWLADVSSIDGRLTRAGHFAVDRDVVSEWAALTDYFRGVASVIGVARTRGYGEADVVDYLVAHGLVSNGEQGGQWQTVAWSRGRRSQYAALYQRAEQPVIGGIACDINDVLAPDWGQHTYQEDDMTPEQDRKLDAVYKGLFYGASANGVDYPPLLAIEAETQKRVTAGNAAVSTLAGLLAEKSGGQLTAEEIEQRTYAGATRALKENVVHVAVDVQGTDQNGATA